MDTAISMPVKEKYKTANTVTMRDGTTRPVMISNGSYKPRTGNSHPKKSNMKRVPKAFKT